MLFFSELNTICVYAAIPFLSDFHFRLLFKFFSNGSTNSRNSRSNPIFMVSLTRSFEQQIEVPSHIAIKRYLSPFTDPKGNLC